MRNLFRVVGLGIVSAAVLILPTVAAPQQTLRIAGPALPYPLTLTPEDLAKMSRQTVTASAHDQKGTYEGVPLIQLLIQAGLRSGEPLKGSELAKYVVVTGADGYRVVFAIAELDADFTDRVVLLADKKDGAPLPSNAQPFQLIVPGERRPARWVRQVVSIEVLPAPSR